MKDRATIAFMDLQACQNMLVNLSKVNEKLIAVTAKYVERLEKISRGRRSRRAT